jgi:predicted MFS family arabinose efflux permease
MQLSEGANQRRSSFIDRIGIYPPLAWGYVGLLLFMIGDGVESGYLSPYLAEQGLSQQRVAMVFTAYGLTAAVAAWLSGALSDLCGPRRVMILGLVLWVVFEIMFLTLGVVSKNYTQIFLFYALRGFAYPLFAFGFLVWITAVTPADRLGTAVGWYWFAFTGGLPTLGSLFASYAVPEVGPYTTLWLSLVLVAIGGIIALVGVREPTGRRRLAPAGGENRRSLWVASCALSTRLLSSGSWSFCRFTSPRQSASRCRNGCVC